MPEQRAHDPLIDDRFAGVRALRRHHAGTLALHERIAQIKLILEASTGRIVMPVEPTFAAAGGGGAEMLLWLPAESDWDLQASILPHPIDRPEASEAVDRWSAYHGATSLSTWVACDIDGLKTESGVFGPEVQQANPLGRAEYPLIKRANADKTRLIAACKAHAATIVPDAMCVGVDPFGIDVKARFGIVRLEFPPGIVATTPEACSRELDRLLGIANGSPA
jgi:hypothetical protein